MASLITIETITMPTIPKPTIKTLFVFFKSVRAKATPMAKVSIRGSKVKNTILSVYVTNLNT